MEFSRGGGEEHCLGLFVFIGLFCVYRALYFIFCLKKKNPI